ncbi:UNVERIFIED_CONTAM: Retrovirus-related Pol polyprotein from transposon [Sesamum radiatum]|uniref:Retrovirus-related Pol polyprotein from transposon n=1 Tax=Sesamum radiatum TaxID=300843 RepID=A0AAW2RG75_SESRA
MEVDTTNPEDHESSPAQEEQQWATPTRVQPAEELMSIQLVPGNPTKPLKLFPAKPYTSRIINYLSAVNADIFTWTANNLTGIDPSIIVHALNVDPSYPSVKLKKRHLGPTKDKVIQDEVSKLLLVGHIKELQFSEWLSNIVLVPKPCTKWRMCIDFHDVNKACPKDFYPLPRINQLVDSTTGHKLLSLMDASQGYHQIMLNPDDQKRVSFITSGGINIQHTEKVPYEAQQCAFGVRSGKFLGYLVTKKGIEVNPEMIRAIQEMKPPTNLNEVQGLARRITALSRSAIKAQALAEFVQEATFTEGSKEYALHFDFKASNNEAEYEALTVGIKMALDAGAKNIIAYTDSQLVTKQMEGEYEVKEGRMKDYLQKGGKIQDWCIEQGIQQRFTSVEHSQAKGQVEVINGILVQGIKTKLAQAGGQRVDALLGVLSSQQKQDRRPS